MNTHPSMSFPCRFFFQVALPSLFVHPSPCSMQSPLRLRCQIHAMMPIHIFGKSLHNTVTCREMYALLLQHESRRESRCFLAVAEMQSSSDESNTCGIRENNLLPIFRIRSGGNQTHNNSTFQAFLVCLSYPILDFISIRRVHKHYPPPILGLIHLQLL